MIPTVSRRVAAMEVKARANRVGKAAAAPHYEYSTSYTRASVVSVALVSDGDNRMPAESTGAPSPRCPLHSLFNSQPTRRRPETSIQPAQSGLKQAATVPRTRMTATTFAKGLAMVLAGREPDMDALNMWIQSFARNGPRFSMKLGKLNELVHIKRVEDAMALVRREEKFPVRFGIPGWAEAVDDLGRNKGEFLQNLNKIVNTGYKITVTGEYSIV